MSPDSQRLFFVGKESSNSRCIYTSKVDGSNITKIIEGLENDQIDFEDIVAY